MNSEQLNLMEQLTTIGTNLDGLKANVHRIAYQDQELQEKLSHIWDVTQELQRQLINPEVIKGQREDAVAQVRRIVDMFQACNGLPDERELAGLGYACELGHEKISLYRDMSAAKCPQEAA